MKHVELSRNEWHFVAERFAAAVRQLLLKSVLLLGDTVCIRSQFNQRLSNAIDANILITNLSFSATVSTLILW